MRYLNEYDLIEDDPEIETDRPFDMVVHGLHERKGITYEVAAVVYPIPSRVGIRGNSKITKMIVKMCDPNGIILNFDRGKRMKTNLAHLQRDIKVRHHIQPAVQEIAVILERLANPIGTWGLSLTTKSHILWTIEDLQTSNADWMTNASIKPDEAFYPDPAPTLMELIGAHDGTR